MNTALCRGGKGTSAAESVDVIGATSGVEVGWMSYFSGDVVGTAEVEEGERLSALAKVSLTGVVR